MSSNKSVREKLIEIYGPECFIEKLHLRHDEPTTYTGRRQHKKMQNLTFHHIRMRSQGGKATVENGALLSNENHMWFHRQSRADQRRMNEAFQRYKARFAGVQLTGDGRIGNQVVMDFDNIGEFIEIPVYPNREEPKKTEERPECVNPDDVIRARMEECWYK